MAKRKPKKVDLAGEAAIRDARTCQTAYEKCVRNNPSQAGRALCKMKLIGCLIKPLLNLDSLVDEPADKPITK